MPRDPLDSLLRLRRLSLEEAMRALATHLAAEAAAEEALACIEAAIALEETAASRLDADDLAVEAFGRWLRRTIGKREAATAARERTAAETGRARAVLGAARAAVAAVEAEIARRTEATRIAGLRGEQAAIDEHAGRRRD